MKGKIARAVIVFGLVGPVAFGQSGRNKAASQPPPLTQQDKATMRLRAEEVLLPISIKSDTGRLPDRLDKTDLIVSEDGKRQRVTAILRTSANVLFIIDASGRADAKKDLNVYRDIALTMIDNMGKDDQAAVISYADQVNLISGWTRDKAALREAIKWKLRPGIESSFYDSLFYAAEEVLPKVSGRRSVVLLSDGVDSFNAGDFERALFALHAARATVYAVGQNAMLLGELKPWVFNKLSAIQMIDPQVRKRFGLLRDYVRRLEAAQITLKGLAEETGGAMWDPPEFDGLKKIAPTVVNEINTEYVVAYVSERPPDDAEFHSIKVYPATAKITVRARRGVYSNEVTAMNIKR
jgi:VWFA-related protein